MSIYKVGKGVEPETKSQHPNSDLEFAKPDSYNRSNCNSDHVCRSQSQICTDALSTSEDMSFEEHDYILLEQQVELSLCILWNETDGGHNHCSNNNF